MAIRRILFPEETFKGLLDYAREMHPREVLLLLRGERRGENLLVKDFLIPPFNVQGEGFASFSPWFLPLDASIYGTVHSHPSGSLTPSPEDYNHFYGRIMIIVAYPYRSLENVAAYNKERQRLPINLQK